MQMETLHIYPVVRQEVAQFLISQIVVIKVIEQRAMVNSMLTNSLLQPRQEFLHCANFCGNLFLIEILLLHPLDDISQGPFSLRTRQSESKSFLHYPQVHIEQKGLDSPPKRPP